MKNISKNRYQDAYQLRRLTKLIKPMEEPKEYLVTETILTTITTVVMANDASQARLRYKQDRQRIGISTQKIESDTNLVITQKEDK